MADYSVALGVRPPQIDIGGAMQLAGSLQSNQLQQQNMLHGQRIAEERLKMAKDQQAMTQAAAAQRLAAERGQRNALSEYNQANAAGDENALNKLASYPDLQSKILGVRSQMDEAQRARFDRGLINNARRAQYVAGLQGEQKNQAWLDVLAEARDAGDITQEMHQQYASQQPNDLLLHNVISQAVPIQQLHQQNAPTAKMRELEAAGIEQGTPEYREQIAPAPLPKYEKVNGRLLKIVPGQDPIDVTPGSISSMPSEKAPSGYRYAPDGTTLEAIPGGPATRLPAGDAAKIAALQTAETSFEAAKDFYKDPGIVDRVNQMLNRGDAGRAERTVRLAVESGLRAMTGAAAPQEEVDQYMNLFGPSAWDTSKTAEDKLVRLQSFLGNLRANIEQGRGAAAGAGAPPGKDQSRVPQGLAPGAQIDESGLFDLPEGSIIKDEQGNRFEKRGGQLVPVR